WTSSIFLPLYQSGHKGLREMFFFIGCSSFIAIQLFNATATTLNCISQICCFDVALISCLAIEK
ncbi:hypothetical protein, partial [Faecalibacterium hattorii]|uniref:hypothetical protein n=1 Tax=Faecalibacterium hattorii TaxID=2935520 RepID=UPI001A9A3812